MSLDTLTPTQRRIVEEYFKEVRKPSEESPITRVARNLHYKHPSFVRRTVRMYRASIEPIRTV